MTKARALVRITQQHLNYTRMVSIMCERKMHFVCYTFWFLKYTFIFFERPSSFIINPVGPVWCTIYRVISSASSILRLTISLHSLRHRNDLAIMFTIVAVSNTYFRTEFHIKRLFSHVCIKSDANKLGEYSAF